MNVEKCGFSSVPLENKSWNRHCTSRLYWEVKYQSETWKESKHKRSSVMWPLGHRNVQLVNGTRDIVRQATWQHITSEQSVHGRKFPSLEFSNFLIMWLPSSWWVVQPINYPPGARAHPHCDRCRSQLLTCFQTAGALVHSNSSSPGHITSASPPNLQVSIISPVVSHLPH